MNADPDPQPCFWVKNFLSLSTSVTIFPRIKFENISNQILSWQWGGYIFCSLDVEPDPNFIE